MGILFVILLIWVVAIAAWFLVQKYATSNDVQKIKDRLVGTTKARKAGKKAAKGGETSVITSLEKPPSRLAQMLVEKYKLGPKIMELLEQAGLRWPPARLVHLCLVTFACGVVIS